MHFNCLIMSCVYIVYTVYCRPGDPGGRDHLPGEHHLGGRVRLPAAGEAVLDGGGDPAAALPPGGQLQVPGAPYKVIRWPPECAGAGTRCPPAWRRPRYRRPTGTAPATRAT